MPWVDSMRVWYKGIWYEGMGGGRIKGKAK